MEQEQDKETSRLAVASLLCWLAAIGCLILFALSIGRIGFFVAAAFLLTPVAALIALIAIVWIHIHRKELKGDLYAILTLFLCLPFLIVMLEGIMVSRAREKSKKENTGLYNLELLGKELVKYAENHNGYLPKADNWCDELMSENKELTKDNFKHPKPQYFAEMFSFKGEVQFAFNRNLSEKKLSDIPGNVVLLFEADGKWNLNGTAELLQTRYREKGYITMLFMDHSEGNYWYYMNAVRAFSKDGKSMYYEQPHWQP